MPHCIRLFSQVSDPVAVSKLQTTLGGNCRFEIEGGDEANWQQVLVTSRDGREICVLERTRDELAQAEIEYFSEKSKEAKPASAALWVSAYLGKARAVYVCQFLALAFEQEQGHMPSEILRHLKSILGSGIIQADGEGFSNEDGCHVTWDFADSVVGPWRMAVLDEGGRWITFEMELGNAAHRAAFLAGRLPAGLNAIPEGT